MFDSYSHGYGNDYGAFDFFSDPEFIGAFGTLIMIFAIILLFGIAVSLTLYIFRSIGLYKISENRGMSGSGLAWIPFVGFYRAGSIADDIAARNGSRSYYRYILLAGSILNIILPVIYTGGLIAWVQSMVREYGYGREPRFDGIFLSSGISSISSLVSLGVYVVTVMALYQIYKCYRPQSATTWTVLTAIPFTNFIYPIFLFIIRNSAPVQAWNAPSGYYQQQQNLPPNINWQYPQYGQPPPYGQPPQNGGYQQPQPAQPEYRQYTDAARYQQPPQPEYTPPADVGYQPPAAPNPPEPWEIDDSVPPPPQAPWENGGDKS